MSQHNSPHVRITARRRDRRKTYHDHQRSPKAENSRVSSSIDGPREENYPGEGHRHQHGAALENSCDSRETERRQNSAEGIPGSVGPGAEPPVAVACHAFAHERTDRRSGSQGSVVASSCDQQKSEGEELESDDVDAAFQAGFQGGLDDSNKHDDTIRGRQQRRAGGNKDSSKVFCSGVESVDNGEETDTLPDSFNFSDECGPEGASTGRIDNADCEPSNFGSASSAKHSRRSRQPSGFASNSSDSHSTSECEEEEEASFVSERSESASSLPRRKPRFGRRGARRPRPLLSMNRNRRIAPSEFDRSAGESEGGRRRHTTSSRGHRYRSPPSHRSRGGVSEGGGRRRAGKGRDRPALTESETGSVSGFGQYEVETARLRQENEFLKQQQERRLRLSDDAVEPWHSYAGEVPAWESSSGSNRRQERVILNKKHMCRLSREKVVHAKHVQQERSVRTLTRAPHPLVNDRDTVWPGGRKGNPTYPLPTCWSDFVSKSHSLGSKGAAWGVESQDGVDLSLPRILVDGGFLWKIPYHSAGTPKRRWFQIKPAEGLLTTASGRLVVRPVEGRGVENRAFGERGGHTGDDSRSAMSMVDIHAAWPLTFIWVDPERDLEKSPPREIGIEEILDVARGHKTPAFWQQAAHRGLHTLPAPELCFSLVGNDRTLDLAAESLTEAKSWTRALSAVALRMKDGKTSGESAFHAAASVSNLESDTPSLCYGQPTENIPTGWKSHRENAEAMARSPRAPRQYRASSSKVNPPDGDELTKQPSLAHAPPEGDSRDEHRAWSADTIRAWRRRLFPAVSRGDAASVVALFEQGCPVDLVETGTGDTALLLACRLGDIGIVGECLRRGSRNDPHPDFGQTALQAAVASGQEACARLLLETAAPSRSDTVVSNHQDPNRETPLHVACRGGYGGIVEALLHHGADMRLVDRKGNTPLHGAARDGNAGALASLLDAGGDAVLEERNARGNRALHVAAAAGHIACVQLLLGTAAEPDVPNADGQTPFTLASIGGHLAVTRLIKQYAPAAGTALEGGGAHIKASDGEGGGELCAISDALPRPHGGGPWSNGPGTPDRQSRDLEHRCYSAASLGHRRNEPPGVTSTRRASQNTGRDSVGDARTGRDFFQNGDNDRNRSFAQEDINTFSTRWLLESRDHPLESSSGCDGSSAPAHGSLFDGLQVYVVGGRQPLGSQQQAATMSGVGLTQAATVDLGSARSSQHYHSQAMSSTSTWGNSFLSAPSTMAPFPPRGEGSAAFLSGDRGSSSVNGQTTPTVGPLYTSAIPGSARALARMIHYSNTRGTDGSRDGTGGREATSRGGNTTSVGGGSDSLRSGEEGDRRSEALGSWMTSSGNHGGSVRSSDALQQQTPAVQADHLSAETGVASANKHNGISEQFVEMPSGTGGWGQANESFVVGPIPFEEGGVEPTLLAGIWHVCYSQGYPYYLHEASGHSQWEDPRRSSPLLRESASTTKTERAQTHSYSERSPERLLEMESTVAAAATDEEDEDEEGEEEEGEDENVVTAEIEAPSEAHNERLGSVAKRLAAEHVERLPLSPIKPVGVSVAVEVSRFVEATPAPAAGAASAKIVGVRVGELHLPEGGALRGRSRRVVRDDSSGTSEDTSVGSGSINSGIDSFASPERPGSHDDSGRDKKSDDNSSPRDDSSIEARHELAACITGGGGHEAFESRCAAGEALKKRNVEGIVGGGHRSLIVDAATKEHSGRGECRRDAGDRTETEEAEEQAWWEGLDDDGSALKGGGNEHGEERQGTKDGDRHR